MCLHIVDIVHIMMMGFNIFLQNLKKKVQTISQYISHQYQVQFILFTFKAPFINNNCLLDRMLYPEVVE